METRQKDIQANNDKLRQAIRALRFKLGLDYHGGKTEIARALGISRSTLSIALGRYRDHQPMINQTLRRVLTYLVSLRNETRKYPKEGKGRDGK